MRKYQNYLNVKLKDKSTFFSFTLSVIEEIICLRQLYDTVQA